ncbi:glutamate 5-kinase [Clostridium botulinum]|uniref:glutamate 5-kinase n=1 Tax=Clostridium botulinum TaxID=1491 RepID=UPI001E3A40EB|nr:glutamate 5-kinase [Clostridium botulinum]MCD3204450.1 glutamate 5-kinase [Clostridium botulinum C/D]MCD3221054.1 glutamate 5-kinase [Clostridium botulinum C/D]MCD3231913.1 glutamate 5-kinase [Clostridium botulinum C/D]MCD3271827.1 glutamate 5-kinase [Clostridium botulinum C/D]MCD3296987.1 glutamate 5-kinase [Clostridium botulinum C/D]
MNNFRENYLKDVKRIVVKVGTSTLTYPTGLLNLNKIENLVRQLSDAHNRGVEVILVSSGAIGAGIGKLGLKEKPKTIPEKQAAAAVGQGILLHMYEKLFSEYGKPVGQILLTREDLSHRTRFLNASNTFYSLLEQGVIPIVNENDAIVVDEIKFGDNDTLSAMVASLVDADLLVLVTDIDGLYDSNPKTNPDAKFIPVVKEITDDIVAAAGGAGSSLGTGGMATKINAGKIATSSGSSMIIVNGDAHNFLTNILDAKEIGTLFIGQKDPLKAKEHWMAFATKPTSSLTIDDGATEALIYHKKSLLPKGIISVNGTFSEGEVISILNSKEEEIAHGITNYNSMEVDLIKGLDSNLIEDKLGHKNYDEVIHRNNLVIVKEWFC